MVVNVDLGALAVELRLGAIARVREPAGIIQARGEHRGNPLTVATAPKRRRATKQKLGRKAGVGCRPVHSQFWRDVCAPLEVL
jgi:hypothetical protein